MPRNNVMQGDHFHMNVNFYVFQTPPRLESAGSCKFALNSFCIMFPGGSFLFGKFSIAFSQDVSSQRGDDGNVVEQSHMRWKSTNEKWLGNLPPPPNVTPPGIAGRSGLIYYHWFALMRPCLNPCFSG